MAEKVKFAETKKDDRRREGEAATPQDDRGAAAAEGVPDAQAPVNIPDVLPDIDLSKKVTDETDFTGKGVAGGTSQGRRGWHAGTPTSRTSSSRWRSRYWPATGNPSPRYPDILQIGAGRRRSTRRSSSSTRSAVPRSIRSRSSSHRTSCSRQAVKNALPFLRFYPAEVGGHKVKQLVQQPFTFASLKK